MKVEKYHVLDELIELNKRQFVVPVYQRNYDWKKENCKKLFNDIVHSAATNKVHFLGSIVCVDQGTDNKITHFLIIDGQQRITTLFLLLKALHDVADSENLKNEIHDLIFNIDKYGDLNLTDQVKIKLKPVKTDNEQFRLIMAEGQPDDKLGEIDTSSNIYTNYEYLKTLIVKAVDSQDGLVYKDILDGIRHLTAAGIMLDPKEDDPQEVFESINSTGLALSLADLIRNYILMTDKDQEKLYNNYWLKIEGNVSLDNMQDFITDYLMFAGREKVKASTAYEGFKKVYKAKNCTNESMLQELLHYSEFYRAFLGNGHNKYSKTVNRYLENFRELDQSTIYPFLFHVFEDHCKGVIEESTLEDVLKLFLTYLVRRLVCGSPTNQHRETFRTLHQRIFTEPSKYDDYYENVLQYVCSFSTQSAIPSDATFKESLINGDLYSKKKLCRHILNTLENVNEDGSAAKEEVSLNGLTIEHIMPQTLTSDWEAELGLNYSQVHDKYLHTLGNLSLTGYNSELGQKTFSEKKQMIQDKKSHIVVLNEDVLNKRKWNENAIKERAGKLSKKLLGIYKVDWPESLQTKLNETGLGVNESNRFTINDDFDATGTRIESFIFLGETFQASSYADMINQLLNIFYELDSDALENLANKNFRPGNGTKPYLTMDKTLLRQPISIGDSGIFYESNMSSMTLINFVRSLMDEYSFDGDELVLYIRAANENEKKVNQYKESQNGEGDTATPAYEEAESSKEIIFHAKRKGINAKLIRNPDSSGYIVLAGSEIDMNRDSGLPDFLKKMRDDGLASGDIQEVNGRYITQKDFDVPSASAACYFVLGTYGHSAKEWIDDNNRTLDNIYGTTATIPINTASAPETKPAIKQDNLPVVAENIAAESAANRESHIFHISRKGINATGYYDPQGKKFVILTGSEIDMSKGIKSHSVSTIKARMDALESGSIVKENDKYYTTCDFVFNTPSAAGVFVLGRSCNGWTDWVDNNQMTLGDIYRNGM